MARYADADDLVFPASDGGYWSRSDFANWRRRVWKPAVERVAASDPALAWLASARPYDCRRSFVSLHLRAGATPLEVASWAGHSPHVMFNHYAGVIQELVGGAGPTGGGADREGAAGGQRASRGRARQAHGRSDRAPH